MDKNIHISMLLELYGKLLTDKQFDAVDLYYNQNLSLSEIAEEFGITRQGVRKNLIEGENKLLDYEEKLKFLKQKIEREQILNEIIENTTDSVIKEKLINLL